MKKILLISSMIFLLLVLSMWSSFPDEEVVIDLDKSFIIEVGENKITKKNGPRTQDALVLYTKEYDRNAYGYEILVEEDTGFVIAKDAKLELKKNTFLLSGHGEAAKFIRTINVGDIVKISINNVSVTRDLYRSNLKRIELEENKVNELIYYRANHLYDIDKDELISLNKELKQAISEFEAYFDQAEIDSRAVDRRVNYIIDLIDYKYYATLEHRAAEGRAVWHRPNGAGISETTLSGVKEFVNRLYDLGINTIYVETYWCGMTTYYSEFLGHQHPMMASYSYEEYGNDYMLALISECHKKGIEVHAWFEILSPTDHYGNYPSYIDPEWMVLDLKGEETEFMDPSNPEVVEFLRSIILEMFTLYDFDGISYDYIRYSEAGVYGEYIDSGITDHAVSEFRSEYGYDGTDLSDDIINDLDIRENWHQFKRDNITRLLSTLTKSIRSIKPEAVISASPFGFMNQAKSIYMQDTAAWCEKGYIDVVLPMIYTENIEYLCQTVNSYKEYSDKVLIFSGIYSLYNGTTLRKGQEMTDAVNKEGVAGCALFASQNYITRNKNYSDKILRVLSTSTHEGRVVSTTANVNDIYNAWRMLFLDRIERVYSSYMTTDELDYINQFMDETGSRMKNPKDVMDILKRIDALKKRINSFTNEDVRERMTEQIDYLVNALDVSISRHLIRYGYWDVESGGERPDVYTLTFVEEEY